jgi:hypothetical protein
LCRFSIIFAKSPDDQAQLTSHQSSFFILDFIGVVSSAIREFLVVVDAAFIFVAKFIILMAKLSRFRMAIRVFIFITGC